MSEMMNKKITDVNYDQSLAVKCINGTFVGKKSENVITYKGIPFVDSLSATCAGKHRWLIRRMTASTRPITLRSSPARICRLPTIRVRTVYT